MELNIIVSGVGGQGILSIAFVLDNAAMKEGFRFKQSEVHGMSQRGGAVQCHLRFSEEEIFSDLLPEGAADLVLSVEPLEALRYVHYLRPGGGVITSASPFVNIPDYPDPEGLYARIASLPKHVLVDAERLAKAAGSVRAQNMVMLGAACGDLPFQRETCLEFVERLFARKGEKAVETNRRAFAFGERLSAFYRAGTAAGMEPGLLHRFCGRIDPEAVDPASAPHWKEVLARHPGLAAGTGENAAPLVPATTEAARRALEKGAL